MKNPSSDTTCNKLTLHWCGFAKLVNIMYFIGVENDLNSPQINQVRIRVHSEINWPSFTCDLAPSLRTMPTKVYNT